MCGGAVVLAFALLVAAPVTAGGPACPTPGYEGAGCLVERGRVAIGCAPRSLRPRLRAGLGRVGRRIASAGRWTARGVERMAILRLERAAAKLQVLRARLPQERRLPDDCRATIGAALDALAAAVAALASAEPSTTSTVPVATTLPAPASTSSTTTSTTSTTSAACGNGRLDAGEQCDGANLFGRTCATLGFTGGDLACGPDCIFDVRGCR